MNQPAEQPRPTELDLACQALAEAKASEEAARMLRIAAEERVIELVGQKEEGAQRLAGLYYRATTTAKLTRSLDYEAFRNIHHMIPDALCPVEHKPALNLRKLRLMETENPELYKLMTQCISTKPAKTAVKIDLL